VGSACADASEDDVEWMTDKISEDPEARLTLTLHTSSAQGQQFLLCPIPTAHANVRDAATEDRTGSGQRAETHSMTR
jgi:hypothetical protein